MNDSDDLSSCLEADEAGNDSLSASHRQHEHKHGHERRHVDEHEHEHERRHEDLEPWFPPEIEREIFELAAMSNLRYAPTLVRVARRVRVWIEPMLYRVIVKADDEMSASASDAYAYTASFGPSISTAPTTTSPSPPFSFSSFASSSSSSFRDKRRHDRPAYVPPLSYYAHHVRHLYLGQSVRPREVSRYLSQCTNVQDLVLWAHAGTGVMGRKEEWLGWLDRMTQLQRLSVNLDELFYVSTTSPGGTGTPHPRAGPNPSTSTSTSTSAGVGAGSGSGSVSGTPGSGMMSSHHFHPPPGVGGAGSTAVSGADQERDVNRTQGRVPWFRHRLFANLTHLQITNVCSSWARWQGLSHLPSLTHLALCLKFDLEVVTGVLAECKHLLVLVLIYDLDMIKESNLGNVLVNVRDYRVIPQYVAEVSQWEHAALKGGVDFWKRAEAVSRAASMMCVGGVAGSLEFECAV
ncbi:hypothetical protein AX16_006517 [Volvariella volvacea WC 439]|nr:hypothetical protein AX16_006517 [Volvariella volvacea WC 439]